MVSINRSFLYGICFASFTWMISLYLLWQLNKTTDVSQLPTIFPSNNKYIETNVSNIENSYAKMYSFKDKTMEEKQAFKKYISSLQALKDLQPVYQNPGMDAYERGTVIFYFT